MTGDIQIAPWVWFFLFLKFPQYAGLGQKWLLGSVAHVHGCVCMCVCMYTCMCAHAYVHMCVSMRVLSLFRETGNPGFISAPHPRLPCFLERRGR